MLTSASNIRESHQVLWGTTASSQQGQAAELPIMIQTHIDNWMLCRMFKNSVKTPYKTARYKSPPPFLCILHRETDCSSDLSKTNDGFVSRIQISQVLALAALVSGYRWGEALVLKRLNNLNGVSCTEEVFCVQALIVHENWLCGFISVSLNCCFVNRLQMLWIKSQFSPSRSSLKEQSTLLELGGRQKENSAYVNPVSAQRVWGNTVRSRMQWSLSPSLSLLSFLHCYKRVCVKGVIFPKPKQSPLSFPGTWPYCFGIGHSQPLMCVSSQHPCERECSAIIPILQMGN